MKMRRAKYWLAIWLLGTIVLAASLDAAADVSTSANYKLAITAVNNGVADMASATYKVSSSVGDTTLTARRAGTSVVSSSGFWPGAVGVSRGCVIDIDGNQVVSPLTDGLMLLRAMLGLTGSAVTAGATATGAPRTSWAEIAPYVHLAALNFSGSGTTSAATDGLLLLRAMFGFTGTAVTDGIATSGMSWASIRNYLNTQCGGSFLP